jgi:hypothetical protein
MRSSLGKAFGAGAIASVIAAGLAAPPAFAFNNCRHHVIHHRVFSHYGWPDSFAQVSSYWRPRGYGCGPFGDNADGWDISWRGVCYYPVGY